MVMAAVMSFSLAACGGASKSETNYSAISESVSPTTSKTVTSSTSKTETPAISEAETSSVSEAVTPATSESSPASVPTSSVEDGGETPDYSKKEYWYQIPEITKDVDTFYIPATEYVVSSFEEGAPDLAEFGNPDVLAGAPVEYQAHASVFEESTNVFMPYYRQAGFKFAEETWQKTGNVEDAISGIP